MDLREATATDVEGIRDVARASLAASYGHAISESLIERAVESWYDREELAAELTDEDAVFVVAVDEGDVVGFVQSYLVPGEDPAGEIDWLHVAPSSRGEGVGDDLLRYVEAALFDRGATRIDGRVLAENEAGTGFYEGEGFTAVGERAVEVGGETFRERRYRKTADGDREALTETRTAADGSDVFVAYDESERASLAPFYPTYADRERATRVGYLCGNCESLDVNADAMGTLECAECDNRRKPTRWDAAYL